MPRPRPRPCRSCTSFVGSLRLALACRDSLVDAEVFRLAEQAALAQKAEEERQRLAEEVRTATYLSTHSHPGARLTDRAAVHVPPHTGR